MFIMLDLCVRVERLRRRSLSLPITERVFTGIYSDLTLHNAKQKLTICMNYNVIMIFLRFQVGRLLGVDKSRLLHSSDHLDCHDCFRHNFYISRQFNRRRRYRICCTAHRIMPGTPTVSQKSKKSIHPRNEVHRIS